MDTIDIALCIALLLVSALFTCALIPLAKYIARKTDAIDYPSGRRVNSVAIPRTGGIAVVGGMALALLLMTILVRLGVLHTPFSPHPELEIDWTWAAIGVLAMFIVGFLDDVFDLPPWVKLIGQTGSACLVVSSGIVLHTIGNPVGDTMIQLGIWAYPITVFYLVAFANIINLIDGLDGLSSGITVIAAASIMLFAALQGRTDVLILGAALIGACLGFLKFNWHPASIFIGDSGALVLGEMLGILSIVAIARSTLFTSLLVPILAAGVPILDTILAIIRRKLAHVPIMSADRGHIHHRLLDSGRGQTQTVTIMLIWTLLLSLSGIGVTMTRGWIRYAIIILAIAVSLAAILKLDVIKPVLAHKYTPRISRRHVNQGTYTQDEYDSVKGGNAQAARFYDKSKRLIDLDSSYGEDTENSGKSD